MKHQLLFDTITAIVEGICAYPQELRCFTEDRDGRQVLVVLPHMADYPKLIGKRGRIVNSLKLLVEQAGVNLGLPLALEIKESFNGRSEPTEPWSYNPDFNVAAFTNLAKQLARGIFNPAPQVATTTEHERVFLSIDVERTDRNATLLGAIDAVLYPYVYASGRKLKLTHLSPEQFTAGNNGFSAGRSAPPADGDTHQP